MIHRIRWCATSLLTGMSLLIALPVVAQNTHPMPRPLLVLDGIVLGRGTHAELEMLMRATGVGAQALEVITGDAATERFGAPAPDGAISIALTTHTPVPTCEPYRGIIIDPPPPPGPLSYILLVDGVLMHRDSLFTDRLRNAGVERIEVIKGAEASRLYGTRACAGVLIVTTTRGAPH